MNYRKLLNENGYLRLSITMLASLTAGIYMVIHPEKVVNWVIILVGVIWILEGLQSAFKIILKLLENKDEVDIETYVKEMKEQGPFAFNDDIKTK